MRVRVPLSLQCSEHAVSSQVRQGACKALVAKAAGGVRYSHTAQRLSGRRSEYALVAERNTRHVEVVVSDEKDMWVQIPPSAQGQSVFRFTVYR